MSHQFIYEYLSEENKNLNSNIIYTPNFTPEHGITDWFQIRKGVHQSCILSLCLFNLYAEYIRQNAGWVKHKLESRLPGEISVISDMQMTPPL